MSTFSPLGSLCRSHGWRRTVLTCNLLTEFVIAHGILPYIRSIAHTRPLVIMGYRRAFNRCGMYIVFCTKPCQVILSADANGERCYDGVCTVAVKMPGNGLTGSEGEYTH
jgi:hypothetical protein